MGGGHWRVHIVILTKTTGGKGLNNDAHKQLREGLIVISTTDLLVVEGLIVD